jgi:diacylglycerol kinase (ATP)
MVKTSIFEHWCFIVNPRAGKGRTTRTLWRLSRMMARYKLHCETLVTEGPLHATELAREKADDGADYVVAVGGDGTINEVVNGLMRSERLKSVKLGVMPLGGGNDLAKTLKLPTDWERAFHTLMQKRTTWIDLGRFDDTWFINSLGIGFDAEVAQNANRMRLLGGFPRYLAAVLKALVTLSPREYGVRLDDDLFRNRYLLISAGNGRFCGGGFQLTPEADLTDGCLDICLVSAATRGRVLQVLPKAINGGHVHLPEVAIRRSASLQVECRDHDLVVYYDGEIASLNKPRRIKISLFPHQLRVICPRGSDQ